MKINKDNVIIIKDNGKNKIGFIPISEEEFKKIDAYTLNFYNGKLKKEDFELEFNCSPFAFILFGKTDEVSSEMLNNLMDKCFVKEGEKTILSYKCFCGEPHGLDYTQTVLHRTALDSFKCLITHCNNTKYGAILNLKHI